LSARSSLGRTVGTGQASEFSQFVWPWGVARNNPGLVAMGLGPVSASWVGGAALGLRAPVLAAQWVHGRTTGHQRTRPEGEKKRQQATGTWRGLLAGLAAQALCTDLTGPPPPKLEDGIGVLNIPRRMFGSNSTWLHASKTRAVLCCCWGYGYRFYVSMDRFQVFSSELKLLVIKCSVRAKVTVMQRRTYALLLYCIQRG